MTVSTTFRLEVIPTFRDTLGRFSRADGELLEARRDEVRVLGRSMVMFLQEEAPKKTGDFARNIKFRTFQQGDKVGFTTSSLQPLGGWIVRGTPPHEIRPRGQGYPLRFVSSSGQEVVAYRVFHPGTQPNPYPERARRRWEPESKAALSRISTRYIAKVTGR